MHRRDLVRSLGAALAIPFLPRSAEAAIAIGERLARESGDVPLRTLNRDQHALVSAVADMIIPRTDTPGALDVRVPEFIDVILTEWANDDERSKFLAGLADIDAKAGALVGQSSGEGAGPRRPARFVDLSPAKRVALLEELDTMRGDASGAGLAFGRLKGLTVYGYFTSKVVDEQVLKTQMFFDGYHGNVPFTPAV